MAIGLVNIDLLDLRTEINVVTYDFPEICASNNRNKWGIHRTYGSGAYAQTRYNTMTSDPDLTFWKGYDQSVGAPGISDSFNLVTDDGGTQTFNIRSLGNYLIERQEYREGEFGLAWYDIPDNETSWFTVTLNTANHTVNTNTTSGTVTGASLLSSLHNAEATLNLVVDSNSGDEREGRIVLDHPDMADTDSYPNQREFTQEEVGLLPGQIEITPASLDIGAEAGTYYISLSAGSSWTSSKSGNFFLYSPSSGDSGDFTISVIVDENTTSFQRSGSISFSTTETTVTLNIVQQG